MASNPGSVSVSLPLLQVLAPALKPDRARIMVDVLNAALPLGDITTLLRLSHFLGQIMVETGQLRLLVESLRYRNPEKLDKIFKAVDGIEHARQLIAAGDQAIANTVYANRNGNGDAASGDGWRYRGRGMLQVTGRGNYDAVGKIVGKPLVLQPELLEIPAEAAASAATYWNKRQINTAADANDLAQVTLLVNGKARLHMQERGQFQVQALAALRGQN